MKDYNSEDIKIITKLNILSFASPHQHNKFFYAISELILTLTFGPVQYFAPVQAVLN